MSNTSFTIDQIMRLREIERAREKRGAPGFYESLRELIARLESGGADAVVSHAECVRQAKVLYDKGFGRELDFDSFDAYLATIPEVPRELKATDERFPELVLVDARLAILKICKLLGVDCTVEGDCHFKDFDSKQARTKKVYWMRAQNGMKNCGKSVSTCRNEFAPDEIGLTVYEGLALFAQNKETYRDWGLELAGTINRKDPSDGAFLHWYRDKPELDWQSVDYAQEEDDCGSASRRK